MTTNQAVQTVLVIGAEGFIGKHAVRYLRRQHTIYATYYPAQPPPDIEGVVWIPCDLTAPDAFDRWPTACDSVIYLAQSARWRDFPDGVLDMLAINVVAPLRAAEYARKASARRVVFASTGSVYTQTERAAYEDDIFALHQLRDFYSASKLATEILLQPYVPLLATVVLRFFMPYGAGQNPTMLIPALIHRVREGRPISLHGQDGLRVNPIAVSDVVETLSRCLDLEQAVTLNVAGPEVLTLREIGEQIGQVLGLSPHFEMHPDEEPPMIVGDISALEAVLSWRPLTDFKTGLERWLCSA